MSKNTYSNYGLKHISNEYEEKFTSGHSGQTDGQLITFKKIRCYKTSYRAPELDRFCAVMYETVTHLLQDGQQNKLLANTPIGGHASHVLSTTVT